MGLQRLTSLINIADLHLIGFSLGGQTIGSTARHYRLLTNESLPHLTGLDPAFPCFYTDKGLTTHSSRDADFVDIIHTNPGVLGQPEATGSADFFVSGHFPLQEGCLIVHTTVLSHTTLSRFIRAMRIIFWPNVAIP